VATAPLCRAVVGIERQSPIPIPYPQKNLRESPQNPKPTESRHLKPRLFVRCISHPFENLHRIPTGPWGFITVPIPIKGKGSPYSITQRRVPELILVPGSQPAGDVSHKPGGRLPLLSARPAVTPATLKRAATNFAAR